VPRTDDDAEQRQRHEPDGREDPFGFEVVAADASRVAATVGRWHRGRRRPGQSAIDPLSVNQTR